MFDDLRDLYQEVILDHGRNPRNCRHPDDANRHARGNNPLCGDLITVHLTVGENGIIRDAAFEGRGCAISTASASLMTEIVKGKTLEQARVLFRGVRQLCMDDAGPDADAALEDEMDRLQVLAGVRQFPVRVKCATLAWHTLNAAIAGEAEVSTEDESETGGA